MTDTATCDTCDGTGSLLPEGCDTCGHNGWVDDPSDGGTMVCPDCIGDAGEDCPDCDGFGYIEPTADAEQQADGE